MKHAAIFKSNRSQAVRIPKEFAFPEGLDRVAIRREGNSIVLTPIDTFWDDFFNAPGIDLGLRDQPAEQERETF